MSLISKVKIGNTTYDLKDADSRQKLETMLGSHAVQVLGSAAWSIVANGVSDNNTNLPTAAQVKTYVDSAVQAIPEFDVKVVTELPDASKDTFHKIYLVQASSTGVQQNVYKEYITVREGSEGAYTYKWEMIGDTAIDISSKVDKSQTIAGIDLQDNITVEELSGATALNLKALAHKDSATGTVEGQTISGVKATADKIDSTISGELAYTATDISSTASYTPAGTISKHTPAGTVTVALADDTTATAATLATADYTPAGTIATSIAAPTGSQKANYTPAGTISTPSITANNTTANVQVMKTAGTAYTLSKGSVTKAIDTTSAFATEGLKASVGTGEDNETLIFTAAGTSNAVTAAGGVTYVAPTLSGALPTFEEKAVVTGTAPALATAPTFTGTGVVISDTFSGTKEAGLKVTGATYLKQVVSEAKFAGTEFAPTFTGAEATITATGSYDKANKGTIAASASKVSLNVGDITVAEKSVTVE